MSFSGGKGIGLAEMTQLGVPVPAGFTITTDACRAYMSNGKALPDGLEEEIERHLERARSEDGQALRRHERSAARLGALGRGGLDAGDDGHDPQPRAQRRGGRGLAGATGNERFANDSYRRLIQMYGEVVDGIDGHRFEQALTDLKKSRGVCAGRRPRPPTISAG